MSWWQTLYCEPPDIASWHVMRPEDLGPFFTKVGS